MKGVSVSSTRSARSADEAEAAVAHQRAGQQARLAQDLEAVADAEHEAAVGGEAHDAVHDRREARHRAAAQVVAVGEAAGQDDAVDAVQRPVFVPERHRDLAEHLLERVKGVVVIERAGEGTTPQRITRRPRSDSLR